MISEILRDRFIVAAYIIGIVTIILAIYIILNPFNTHYYYSGPAINGSFTVNPSEIVFIMLRTNNSNLNTNITIIKWIPETNITLTLYYMVNLGPYQLKELNFTTITNLNLASMGRGQVTIIGIYRPEIINVLTIILTILFILVIALLIIGFTESIINIHGKV
ncbi:MAG: hypothetical protein ACP5NQ_00470 [Vulcanisaeta sp.]|uniref:Uncharacterized protein n=1 Tax=Vulcanisaeta moutnovskia (strain 768-28) TaxID=985053 RepID=F0QUL0_VULM7|nr:hypothetical protein [Vulcanisaeta moutnovskia]ADY00671.1 hypothetical protein VMUT_0459 [Vulcanisaeta moutnovskia 768-28]